MGEKLQFVIHFGSLTDQLNVNHSIKEEVWKQKLSIFSHQTDDYHVKHKRYKIYQYSNIYYEHDLNSGDGLCYKEEIDNINIVNMPNEKVLNSALSYIRKRSFLNELDFAPLNRYYNIHYVDSYEFSHKNREFSIIFEKKEGIHEIKLLSERQSYDHLDQLVNNKDLHSTKIE